MFQNILRAIRLEPDFYRQVAANPAYTQEATIIAVTTSILAALGAMINSQNPLFAFLSSVLNNILIGWLLWAVIAYFVGTRMYQGRSTPSEMIRVLGYASAPRLLGLFAFVPCVGWILSFVGWLLCIVAGVIAIRESMEFDTNKAGVTAIVGFILYVLVNMMISLTFAAVAVPFSG